MWRDEPFWLCFGATRVFAHYEYIPEYLARIDFLLTKYYYHENSNYHKLYYSKRNEQKHRPFGCYAPTPALVWVEI